MLTTGKTTWIQGLGSGFMINPFAQQDTSGTEMGVYGDGGRVFSFSFRRFTSRMRLVSSE